MVLVKSIVGNDLTYPYWGSFDTLNKAKKAAKKFIDQIYKEKKNTLFKKINSLKINVEKYDGSKYFTAYTLTIDGLDRSRFFVDIHDFDKEMTNKFELGNAYAIRV